MSDDINRDSIARLVAAFYARARLDPVLGPIFEAKVTDWDHHLEKITAFWASAMLRAPGYQGNPFAAHVNLPLRPCLFGRWLGLWEDTTAQLFPPETAAAFNEKAERIARRMVMGMFFKPEREARRAAEEVQPAG